ncbi:MAG: hypothetical protein LBB91_08660, partial [Clostridiales bacterium]|nr:hypothetical protein [Clostridiales bacterium]
FAHYWKQLHQKFTLCSDPRKIKIPALACFTSLYRERWAKLGRASHQVSFSACKWLEIILGERPSDKRGHFLVFYYKQLPLFCQ